MRALALSLFVVALLAIGVSASWMRPKNLSPECPTPNGGSFLHPASGDLCNECCERCYALHFKAKVVDGSATNTAYCNVDGDLCPVWVFFRIAPCCACSNLEISESTSICTETGKRNVTTQTESLCQIKNLTMLVGPDHEPVTDLFSGCDANEIVMTKFAHESDAANEHYTVIALDACTSSPGGGGLQLVYSAYHDGVRFPDICFADSHFESSIQTTQFGTLASSLVLFGPASPSSAWLVANMSDHAPLPMQCRLWDAVLDDQCTSNALESIDVAAIYAASQIGLPEEPKANHHGRAVAEPSVAAVVDSSDVFGMGSVDSVNA